jgi:hydrogenase expression/formation protein HypC
MCLSIPAQIIELESEQCSALVETFGVRRKVSTYLLSDALLVGDYLLIHVGFAMSKIDPEEAAESLKVYELLLAEMGETTHPLELS